MLSKRLKLVASLVTTKSVIDIGCDHGYLDIYLTKKGISCLATDISKSSLNKAIMNFKKENLNIDTKLTDGLNNIVVKADDTIIISGMGTNTIMKILSKNISNDLIISSHNNIEKLRRFIVSKGYYISDELFIIENDIPYIIIKFKKGYKKYNDYDYIIGPVINDLSYFQFLIEKYSKLLTKIPNKYIKKRNYYQNLINYIKIKINSLQN